MELRSLTLENSGGTRLVAIARGATISKLWFRDRNGELADVVLGFDSPAEYESDHPYFGAIVGRGANRIARGRFELDGREYSLAANDGAHHLHGGRVGFDKHDWESRTLTGQEGAALEFRRVSPDGEEGYPGRLECLVRYSLSDDDVLRVEMTATTDAPTIVNLAQHTYWNLGGHGSGSVAGHLLRFAADRYVPVGPDLIPTGEIVPVAGTPFDFRTARSIGSGLEDPRLPGGYDHSFEIAGEPGRLRPVCEVLEPRSGRRLELRSDQPGCQFYSGNFLDGTIRGKGGGRYARHQGFCLETQSHPDAIHRPEWASPVLRPGETYRHRMEIRLSVAR
ncbi:MAG: aldose epimerase family protein [Planctomycetota bacterium]